MKPGTSLRQGFGRCFVADEDPFAALVLEDRLRLVVFELQLAGVPQSLITALWEAIDLVQGHTPANFEQPRQ